MTSATSTDHTSDPSTAYHHGDLPNALRRAAVEVIEQRGIGAFSLREVARRAGVSHTAPAHHFGDVKGLLTSVATEGFEALHKATSEAAAAADSPVERLAAIGRAYVRLARTQPAYCAVMFRTDIVNADDGDMLDCGLRAYAVLETVVREVIGPDRVEAELDRATWLCWSAMQGLVQLAPKLEMISALKAEPDLSIDDVIHDFTQMIVGGIG